jgi:hypothetical protein
VRGGEVERKGADGELVVVRGSPLDELKECVGIVVLD